MWENKKIAVLSGGRSSEREVSLRSGKAVETALKEKGLKVITLDSDENIAQNLKKERIDLAFIALHGKYGEDGTIQGLLELLNIPYTGSGVLASALALNKILAKKVFKAEGIPAPEVLGLGTRSSEFERQLLNIRTQVPVVVKPVSQGSTLGVTIVKKEVELKNALKKAFEYDKEVFVEKYIQGTEVTVSILGNENPQVLPLIEIIPESGFYDYEAKYIPGKSKHIIPPRLPKKYCEGAGEMALKAHFSLRCQGFSRVEVIINKEGIPYILDLNTIPGMTEISLYPEAARAAGIEFGDLCLKLLELALEK